MKYFALICLVYFLIAGVVLSPALAQSPFEGPGVGTCRIGDVQGCQRICGGGGSMQGVKRCGIRGWGSCRVPQSIQNREELCNGIDDNCNGVIDEGADAACDDGLDCSHDVCSSGRCSNPAKDICQSSGCAEKFCGSASLSQPPPGFRYVQSTNGCTTVLNDEACQDNCDCNGREQCSFSTSSCAASPNPSPCENDGNLCTTALCCDENTEDCLFGPYSTPPNGEGLSELERRNRISAAEQICDLARRANITFTRPSTDPNPTPIECVIEKEDRVGGFLPIRFYSERSCEVNNECTVTGRCIPETGECQVAHPHSSREQCTIDRDGQTVGGSNSCGRPFCNGLATGCTGDGCPLSNCELVDPASDPSMRDVSCPEIHVPRDAYPPIRPGGDRWWLDRLAHTEGEPVDYRVTRTTCGFFGWLCSEESVTIPSCHISSCPSSSLECGISPRGVCPPAEGECFVNTCTGGTDVLVGSVSFDRRTNAVIGCVRRTSDALCPPVECQEDSRVVMRPSTCSPSGVCRNPCLIR